MSEGPGDGISGAFVRHDGAMQTDELIANLKLPDKVWEALDDTYFEDEKQKWLLRYALTGCKRRRATMVYLLLQGV